ncbi:EI24 domain-containing protein [Cephalotus follicularis]|uniref:EI24 domain-containing protein n=1 Tax=Cephalotus follicularis TaxID=3775 RepID=A0A1Q3AZS4_CEPFO|nr:EI24 domain-containing protein [Cephalotus follicularis]
MEEESRKEMIMALKSKAKQAFLLYLDGVKEASCLHRVFVLCHRSRKLLIRTGQCFLLNGFIYLGSLFILKSIVIPALNWILPHQCLQISSQKLCSFGGILKFYSFLRLGLIQLFYIFWFYPLYLFSLIQSSIWYNDIAEYGCAAMGRSGPTVVEFLSQSEALTSENTPHMERRVDLGRVMIEIGEQAYSLLLLSLFFMEVYVTGFVPYIGKALNFILLSWMYAYYCFEYKWNYYKVSLDRRLDFFESNWPFFAGFGSPCVLAIFFFSPLVSYGVMAILFPLFVLTATGSGAEEVISSQRRKLRGTGLGRLPIFYAADTLSMWMLSLIPLESKTKMQDNKMY